MIFFLDNYDSFTYNLVQYVGVLDPEIEVRRNDKIFPEEVMNLKPDGIIISPGPKTPQEAGISIDLIRAAKGLVPILGVCLGHQAIGEVFGGKTVPAKTIVHGKSCFIEHTGEAIFKDIPPSVEVTRYHSLVLDPSRLSRDHLNIIAKTHEGLIMGIQSVLYPEIWGVQFHPESILTQYGTTMIKNFVDLCVSKKNSSHS